MRAKPRRGHLGCRTLLRGPTLFGKPENQNKLEAHALVLQQSFIVQENIPGDDSERSTEANQ